MRRSSSKIKSFVLCLKLAIYMYHYIVNFHWILKKFKKDLSDVY